MGGQIGYSLETVASVAGHVKAGRLKILGVTTGKRSAGLPDVPTLAEAAEVPGYDIGAWIGYAAPPGTPLEIRSRLAAEIAKAMQAPDLRERYLALGMEPASNAPAEMDRFLRNEQARYGTIIRNANIKVE
jgi:tripartite-type tricarboxylate transporter receptor subunit TctC